MQPQTSTAKERRFKAKRRFWAYFGLCVGLSVPVLAAPRKDAAKAAELARVAVIRYEDKTGTRNFDYMPASLSAAIDKSLRGRFEYVGADLNKVEDVAAEVRQAEGGIDAAQAAEICRRTGVDILIFGSFVYDESAKEIEIRTFISLGTTAKFKTLPPARNRVDNTIFQLVDKVAVDILGEIVRVAEEQKTAERLSAAKGKDKNAGDKTQLQKIVREKTWHDTTWAIYASGGTLLPVISLKDTSMSPGVAVGVFATRRIAGAFHVGFSAAFNSLKTESKAADVGTTFRTFDFIPSAVYNLDFRERWRFSSALGVGYYFGALVKEINCAGDCSATGSSSLAVTNPVFLARTGIHYLWLSSLAVGVDAEWRVHYDSPKSLNTALLTIAISWVY